MNLHYKEHHHHQRYCKCAQKIHLFAHKFSRLCFTSHSCTYKVKVMTFIAIEMLTCDITGSHSLTKTASYCVKAWANVQPGSLSEQQKESPNVQYQPTIDLLYKCVTKRWITGKLNIILGLLISELQSGWLSNAITQHHVVFDHLAIQYLPLTDLTKVTGKTRKVWNTHTVHTINVN